MPRAPNKGPEGENRGGRTAWQDYVKANLAQVREKYPGKGMKVWMEELGKGFREDRMRVGMEKGEGEGG